VIAQVLEEDRSDAVRRLAHVPIVGEVVRAVAEEPVAGMAMMEGNYAIINGFGEQSRFIFAARRR
jgi:hypothetical protein